MGFDLGKFVRNVLTGGSTYFRDQRQAKEDKAEAQDLIAQNTDLAQQLFDEDLGSSALAQIASDPEMKRLQQRTLDGFGERSRDGWTALDRQALEAQNMQSRQEEQSQRGAVMDAAARRGDTSGGNALMASLAAGQGGANRAAQRGTGLAVEGRQRALDALANQGQMAGQMRGQQFSEDATTAGAMDQFRQWAAGERTARGGLLMNARTGQSTAIDNAADELASSDTAGAIANGALAVYTGGLSGAAGGLGNTTGTPGASSAKGMPGPTGATAAGGGPQQKGMPSGGIATPGPGQAPQRTMTFGGGPRPAPGGPDPRMSALNQIAGGGNALAQRRPKRPGVV